MQLESVPQLFVGRLEDVQRHVAAMADVRVLALWPVRPLAGRTRSLTPVRTKCSKIAAVP